MFMPTIKSRARGHINIIIHKYCHMRVGGKAHQLSCEGGSKAYQKLCKGWGCKFHRAWVGKDTGPFSGRDDRLN